MIALNASTSVSMSDPIIVAMIVAAVVAGAVAGYRLAKPGRTTATVGGSHEQAVNLLVVTLGLAGITLGALRGDPTGWLAVACGAVAIAFAGMAALRSR